MAQRILLVEDSPTQALQVEFALDGRGFVVEIATNGLEGIDRALNETFDLILLDHHLPGLSGLEILERIRLREVKTPVVMITGSTDVRVAVETMKRGAADYVVKDDNYIVTLLPTIERVLEKQRLQEELEKAQAEIKKYTQGLERTVQERTQELKLSYHATVNSLVAALDAREHETRNHSQRVALRTRYLGMKMGLKEQELSAATQGAILHDVGKIGVPDSILLKPGCLTPEEWTVMRKHPGIGYGVLADIGFLTEAREIVLAHQEWYDGSGYPNGLRGEEIPMGARIFSIIDALDAITHDRPYRKGQPYQVARDEIAKGAGSQFDPEVISAFLAVPETAWPTPGEGQAYWS